MTIVDNLHFDKIENSNIQKKAPKKEGEDSLSNIL